MWLLVYIVAVAVFILIFTREVVAPASGATCDKRWQILAGAVNAANFAMTIAAGFLFDFLIPDISVFDLKSHLDPVSGGILTFLVASFFAYWWHRLSHRSDTVWRHVHQLHHAPPRIEALTAFYMHPLDSFLALALNALVAYGLLGVNGVSMTVALILVTLFDLVAHADQRTPQWLGYITQRPEMHRVHHQYGHHRQNYGLPIWDMMFGTFSNPEAGPERCGFDETRSVRIKDMLLFKDVHKT